MALIIPSHSTEGDGLAAGGRSSSLVLRAAGCAMLALGGRPINPFIANRRQHNIAAAARGLNANRLALDHGVPSGRITDILNGRRSISADTALRLGRYLGNDPQLWLELPSQYDLAVVESARGAAIARRVKPAAAA